MPTLCRSFFVPPSLVFVSLSNIVFAPGSVGHIALPLVNGWTGYGSGYGSPDYTVRNGMCSLEGLLWKSGGGKEQLALLPEDCRPSHLAAMLCDAPIWTDKPQLPETVHSGNVLIFETDNHGVSARVDVYPTGEVYWIAGGTQEWVSVSGIVFATHNSGAPAYPIALQNGWGSYGAPCPGDVSSRFSKLVRSAFCSKLNHVWDHFEVLNLDP